MSSFSSRLLHKLPQVVPAVKIEKASADPVNGVAKVLFSTNLPKAKQAAAVSNASVMETAFAAVLGDKAHVMPSTIHKAATDGFYYGFVKINNPMIAEADAKAEGSAFHEVTANVFADASDNIWEVREDASGNRVLMRNVQEDLTELFAKQAAPANMSVAAASIAIDGAVEFASVLTFLDPASGKYVNGIALDQATVYDFEEKKAKKISNTLVIAAQDVVPSVRSNLNEAMGDKHSTFEELADANVQEVYNYLDTLYGSAPTFLAAYKDAIRRLIDLPSA
ncbi:hypothetical protein EVC12_144 [Rhizobium phage RHph_I42]|nr:hypothetical protein EVC12_144 [Rhizobium phage RHph_I42]